MSCNPELGTIAVCLEIVGEGAAQTHTNVIMVWPSGRLQNEEPLKLRLEQEESNFGDTLPANIILSRGQGTQIMHARLRDGRLIHWRFNFARSQLVHEATLAECVGVMASSDDGNWVAAAELQTTAATNADVTQLYVWLLQGNVVSDAVSPVCILERETPPTNLAITWKGSTGCLLAVAQQGSVGIPPRPVEVLFITCEGAWSSIYQLKVQGPSYSLDFCYDTPNFLVSGHSDGSVVIFNLLTGEISQSHDSPGTGCISISPDRKLIVSAEANCFRIYEVPDPAGLGEGS